MPVDYCCEDYDEMSHAWSRARDFLAGERTVKGKGETYLPKLQDQNQQEYEDYRDRTSFLNATNRTHEALVGLIFLKDPVLVLPSVLNPMKQDANMSGDGLYGYMRRLVNEIIAVGRGGTLVDWSVEEGRPYFAYYEAESIINWRYDRLNGKQMLSLVVLKEQVEEADFSVLPIATKATDKTVDPYEPEIVERLRVLRLVPEGEKFVYIVEIWSKTSEGEGSNKKTVWTLDEVLTPVRSGVQLEEIPFVFHSPDRVSNCVIRPPLDDLISLNLTHYRLSADHYHGLHFVALPTPWVAGFDTKTTPLRIGSGVAWVSDNSDASAGYLEFSGAGLGAIREELERLEKSMAVLGARLLEQQKRAVETAEAMSLRQSGEEAVLGKIASSMSDTLREALKWANWWGVVTIEDRHSITDKQLSVELNTDYSTGKMTGAEVVSLVSSWIQRGISRDTLFWNLKAGDIIPPERTLAQELELIEAEPPPTMFDLGGEPIDDEDKGKKDKAEKDKAAKDKAAKDKAEK